MVKRFFRHEKGAVRTCSPGDPLRKELLTVADAVCVLLEIAQIVCPLCRIRKRKRICIICGLRDDIVYSVIPAGPCGLVHVFNQSVVVSHATTVSEVNSIAGSIGSK